MVSPEHSKTSMIFNQLPFNPLPDHLLPILF
ncbi:MAG: hypothetical protein ACI8P3_004513 [Saprospiraceae bacterium]